MTVSTTINTVTATGDNSTTEFSFPYLVFQASHLTITLDGVATSAWSAATYGAEAGVTVTFDSAPATDVAIVIQRIVPYTQDTDLENFDGTPSEVTEKQFDLLAMADQQIIEEVDRSILAPIGTTLTTNNISGTIDTTVRALTITTAGPASSELSDFPTTIDVVVTTPTVDDVLAWDGASWVNGPTTVADNAITLAKMAGGTDGNLITYDASGDPAYVATGTSGQVLTSNGAGAAPTFQSAATAVAYDHIAGLVLTTDTDADHDINVTAGQASDSTNSKYLTLASEMTKQLDAAWSAGDDAGGLFSGSIAADTLYYMFLIEKDSDDSIDVGFDTSITAANIPAGYTEYRRIGSVTTDSSSNILGITQKGVFETVAQTFTASSEISPIKHGLDNHPKQAWAELTNVTTQYGYGVGDIKPLALDFGSGNSSGYGIGCWFENETEFIIRFNTGISINRADNFSNNLVTPASWTIKYRMHE